MVTFSHLVFLEILQVFVKQQQQQKKVLFFFLMVFLQNGAEHLLENQEHLSAIRALASARLDTWKTFAQTAGAKSFSDWKSFSPKLCGICSPLSFSLSLCLPATTSLLSLFLVMCAWEAAKTRYNHETVV